MYRLIRKTRSDRVRIVLIGPPGAGKGTQADKRAGEFAVPHISTGQLFRESVSVGTRLAMAAKHYLDADELVPSEVTNALVEARINHSDAAHGFILDAQAEALTRMPAVRDQGIDTVLQFQVCEAALLTRIKDPRAPTTSMRSSQAGSRDTGSKPRRGRTTTATK